MASTSIARSGQPSARAGLAVTGAYFDLLGATAARGRTFAAGEADYPDVRPVVVISDEVWQGEFGGAPDVIGRTLRVNGRPLEVIGVMPKGFGGHRAGLVADVFVPHGLDVPGLPTSASMVDLGSSGAGRQSRAARWPVRRRARRALPGGRSGRRGAVGVGDERARPIRADAPAARPPQPPCPDGLARGRLLPGHHARRVPGLRRAAGAPVDHARSGPFAARKGRPPRRPRGCEHDG
jgi:hypothetical protein